MDLRVGRPSLSDRAGAVGLGLAFGPLLAATPAGAVLPQPATTPVAWVPPPGVIKISESVPQVGERWVSSQDFPLGPIYAGHQGGWCRSSTCRPRPPWWPARARMT
jgi:hypothetical protein